MKTLCSRAVLACGAPMACLVLAPSTSCAQAASSRAAHVRLTVAASAWNCGVVRQGQVVKHAFVLRNDTAAAVTIERVVPAGECTASVAGSSRSLPAGSAVRLDVSLDTGKLAAPGVAMLAASTFSRGVYVYVAGEPVHAAAVLELHGYLACGVSFEPVVASFGNVPCAAGAARFVRVCIDRELCASKCLRLVPPGGSPLRASEVPSPAAARSPKGLVVKTYRVSVPPGARLGPLDSALRLEGLASASSAGVGSPPIYTRSLPVLGEVIGAVRAEPARIVFGLVRKAEAAGVASGSVEDMKRRTRWILLVARPYTDRAAAKPHTLPAKPTAVKPEWGQVRVKVEGDGLEGTVVPVGKVPTKGEARPPALPDGASPERTCWLRVTLLPTAASGKPLAPAISLRFANGERMVLPVLGTVE